MPAVPAGAYVVVRQDMNEEPAGRQPAAGEGGLLVLASTALLAGAVAGTLCTLFRLLLARAEQLRGALIAAAHGLGPAGFTLTVAGCAAATCLAAWLVSRFSPNAAGSGIPHVEAVLEGKVGPAAVGLVLVKFIGGLLAIGAGLALGREGPSVQIGAFSAVTVGRILRRTWTDCRVLLAAGAGAGLATAFNAPISGSVFVLEELVKRFESRIAIAVLATVATAIALARTFLGETPDFHVPTLAYAGAAVRPLFFLFGAVAGLLAVAYNRTLLATMAATQRLTRIPAPARAALIGAAIGVLGWFAPGLVGGGDDLTQAALLGAVTLGFLPCVFLLRFALGAVSYAAGTPGGLFAPILVLGAQSGLLFGVLCRNVFPDAGLEPEAFAVVGMAAFFTGVVRAPITAIVLACEMTGSVRMLLPMLGACAVAMIVPTLLGNAPIYDSLRENLLRRAAADRAAQPRGPA